MLCTVSRQLTTDVKSMHLYFLSYRKLERSVTVCFDLLAMNGILAP